MNKAMRKKFYVGGSCVPGFGRVGQIDKNLNEEDARRAFLSVLWEVRIKLTSFGESIPIEFLRSLIKRGGNDEIIRFFKPGQTDPLLAAVADLEELIGD